MTKTTKRQGRAILNGLMDIPAADDPRWMNVEDVLAEAEAMAGDDETEAPRTVEDLHAKVWAKWNGGRNG